VVGVDGVSRCFYYQPGFGEFVGGFLDFFSVSLYLVLDPASHLVCWDVICSESLRVY